VTFQHWAGVTAYTAPCGFARCCVFVKQSLPPALCHPLGLWDAKSHHLTWVLLLPKLRRHFAEFLNHSSPDRLSILYSPTWVGLGYGRCIYSLLGFSWQCGISDFSEIRSASCLGVCDLNSHRSPPTHLPGDYHRPGTPILLRPPSVTRVLLDGFARRQPPCRWIWALRVYSGTGISTSCASTTPLGLVLAPDLPWED